MLQLAEMFFAELSKNLRDAHACFLFDFHIHINKGTAELLGQHLAGAGLAGAHEANQNDITHARTNPFQCACCKQPWPPSHPSGRPRQTSRK